MTGQNVFHGLTKREELLLKNYLLEIPISSRRPIPIWSYQSSAPCPVQIVSPKTQLGFFIGLRSDHSLHMSATRWLLDSGPC